MNKRTFGLLFVVTCIIWSWWITFRFYVPPGYMAILTAKTGLPLPPGQILAQPGQQGIQELVLGEGRYFYNPFLYDWKILPAITIPAGKVGVVVSKIGADLPEGEFLADTGQKGIWRQVLGPGRYRLNPYGYNIELADAVSVPIGYVGVVTGLSGTQPPSGKFAGSGEKGVRKDVLQPGLYYINPKELRIDVLEIGVNQVSLLGQDGGAVITKTQFTDLQQNAPMVQLSKRALDAQQEKRRDYMVQRGLSFNYSERTNSDSVAEGVDTGQEPIAQQSEIVAKAPTAPISNAMLNLDQVVEFPSRDGFEISLDMTVEFELLPEHIAWIYQSYGDLPAVVDNIIMPQILSVSRLKGSAYRAKDFIVGAGREQFQKDLTEALAKTLDDKRIVIHNALIRHVNVPMDILDPIQQASIAAEQNLTNKEKQNTARKQAELNTETSLIEQRRAQVDQETEKMRAEIRADQERQVAELRAKSAKQVAEIQKQTAKVRAERTRTLGEAQAQMVTLIDGEKAAGMALKSAAIGDPKSLTLLELAINLNEQVRVKILHAGDGTLWTDMVPKNPEAISGVKMLQQW